jgi:hypothetical protein
LRIDTAIGVKLHAAHRPKVVHAVDGRFQKKQLSLRSSAVCRPRATICACLQLVVVVLLALVPLPGPQVARPPCHRDRSSVVRNIVSKVLNPKNHTKDNNAPLKLPSGCFNYKNMSSAFLMVEFIYF